MSTPNELLALIRNRQFQLRSLERGASNTLQRSPLVKMAMSMADAISALDTAIQESGDLPDAWQKKEEDHGSG